MFKFKRRVREYQPTAADNERLAKQIEDTVAETNRMLIELIEIQRGRA